MRARGREIRNNCAEPGPVQALFEGADLWLPRVNRDWAGQPAGPAMSAMPRKRRLAVRMSPVAKGQFQTYVLAKIAARCQPESVVRTADDRAICTRSVTHSDENGAALIGDCQNVWNLRRHKLALQYRRRAPRPGARSVGAHGSPGPHT